MIHRNTWLLLGVVVVSTTYSALILGMWVVMVVNGVVALRR